MDHREVCDHAGTRATAEPDLTGSIGVEYAGEAAGERIVDHMAIVNERPGAGE